MAIQPPSPQDDSDEPPPGGPAEVRRKGRTVTPEDLLAAMDQLDQGEKGWLHTILTLGLSLFLFFSLGLLQASLRDVALIVLVIFVHESGHYLGMRIFNYRNVKMFFIPFLGAAVSGKRTQVEGWKQAVVCLLGPLPGIGIGIGLYLANWANPDPLLGHLASLFLLLNAFQLIPIYPLDGGRFLNEVLFVRSRVLETGFLAVAGLVAIGAGLVSGSYFFCGIGAFVLISAPNTWRIAGLASDMRELGMEPLDESEVSKMPIEAGYVLLPELARVFPNASDLRILARYASDVWERVCMRPPGWLATLLLLGAYGGSIAVLIGVLLFPVIQFRYWMERGHDDARAQNYPAAEASYREALALTAFLPADDLTRTQPMHKLAEILVAQKREREAEWMLREELALRELVQGVGHPDVADVLEQLSNLILLDPSRTDEAKPLRERVRQIRAAARSGARGPP